MATDPAVPVPNPVWAGSLDEQTARQVADRFVEQGLLAADHDQHDVRQAINDMNHRLRYAAGEYDSPAPSFPLPP